MNPALPHLHKIKPYEPGKPLEELKREFGLSGFLKLASNENTLGPAPEVKQAMLQALDEVLYYPDPTARIVREELSRLLNLPGDWFHFGNGTEEILAHIARAFLDKDSETVLCRQTFPIYSIHNQIQQAKEVFVPLKDFRYDLKSIAESITQDTKLVYLCNPNNPTGTWFNVDEFSMFAAKLPKEAVLVVDEAYFEYVDAQDFPNILTYFEEIPNLIVTRTFSKGYGLAGLRLGYCIARPEIIQMLTLVKEPFNINSVVQQAAVTALKCQDYVAQLRQMISQERKRIGQALSDLGFLVYPSQTNFLFVRTSRSPQKIVDGLLKKGIAIRPLGASVPDGLRISLGTKEENDQFLLAIGQLFASGL